MIVGVDHVALACADVATSVRLLEAAGFQLAFAEQDVPNAEGKRRVLEAFHGRHSVAYMRGPVGVPIELTNYGAPPVPGESPYQVLLGAMPENARAIAARDARWTQVWRAAGLCDRARAAEWASLGAAFWVDPAGEHAGVRSILVPTQDVQSTGAFWREGVGCREVSHGQTSGQAWTRLRTPAALPDWCLDVVIAGDASARPEPLLDSAGFPCVAMLVSALEADVDRLNRAGARRAGDPFEVAINGRTLRVAFLRGPASELIELVEIARAEHIGEQHTS